MSCLRIAFVFCSVLQLPTITTADEAWQIVAHAVSDPQGATAFTFQPSRYAADITARKEWPIGVFDSGIGGLTVLEAILSADNFDNQTLRPGPDGVPDFENESFIYLGDQANMPYGNYSAEGKTDTLREHILKDLVFLLGRRSWPSAVAAHPSLDKPPVKAVVIACNTATAYGLDDIRKAIDQWDIPVPVVGVVEAGARGLHAAWPEKKSQAVAVFATVGTCASGAYPRIMQATLGRAGYRPANISQHGSPDLAAAIEGAAAFRNRSVSELIQDDVLQLIRQHQQQLSGKEPLPIGTVVLGCTHFPLVQSEIEAAFDHWRTWKDAEGEQPYREWISEELSFIDPASWTAKELFRELARGRLRRSSGVNEAHHRFYISVPNTSAATVETSPDSGFTYAYKYGRVPGNLATEDTKVVPMLLSALPGDSQRLIREKLPRVAVAIPIGLEDDSRP